MGKELCCKCGAPCESARRRDGLCVDCFMDGVAPDRPEKAAVSDGLEEAADSDWASRDVEATGKRIAPRDAARDFQMAPKGDAMRRVQVAAVICGVAFLLCFFALPGLIQDTWEEDNSSYILSAKERADSLLRARKYAQAASEYRSLVEFVRGHRLKNHTVRSAVGEAEQSLRRSRELLAAERTAETVRREHIKQREEVEQRRREEEERELAEEREQRRREAETKLSAVPLLRGDALQQEAEDKKRRFRAARAAMLVALLEEARAKNGGGIAVAAKVGNGRLTVKCRFDVLWMAASGSRCASRIQFSTTYRTGSETTFDTNGFFNVSGEAQEIESRSADPAIASGEGCFYGPQSLGKTDIVFTLAGQSLRIPVIVAEVPVKIGMSAKEVIQEIGLPDDKLTVMPVWPETKCVHNVWYHTRIGGPDDSGEHWKYERYPGAVLVIRRQKLFCVSSTNADYAWPKELRRLRGY